MKALVLALVIVTACKDSSNGAPAPSASAQPSASAPTAEVVDTHGKWWDVAGKSRVFTAERRQDADNAIRLLPPDKRNQVRRTLDDMATQSHTGDGIDAAAQIAREGQEKLEDVHNPAAKNAITTAGFIVIHGLIALACAEHSDMKSLNDVMVAVREMPLPHLEKGNGTTERLTLEQEMKMALDDKTMKSVLAAAPPPKKSL